MQYQRFQPRLVFGACGLIVVFAAVAFYAGDHKAAAIIATQALIVFCFAYSAAKRNRARRV
jgi:hypothetical protein